MENEVRLIDANALLKNRFSMYTGFQGTVPVVAVRDVDNAPTIDPESLRPKGRWRKYSSDEWICTNCGYDKFCDTLEGGVLPDFCEDCGAKMEG